MRSVTGDQWHLPRRIGKCAAQHAIALGRDVMTDDLLLVALLELDADRPARRALEAVGITRERVFDGIHATGDEAADQSHAVTYSPAMYTIAGRAEAFGAALGEGPMTPEHVLLALLWDPVSGSSRCLWKLGVAREDVLERLRELGARVPAAPLPPQREIDWGERVLFERDKATVVLEYVRLQLSPTTAWAFNYEGDQASVIAESRVDLQALVNRAVAA